jgi:zinc protease
MTKEQLDKITLADAQAWFEKIAKGPIEVAIVGDIDQERSLALILKYLGSLPKTEAVDLSALRKVEQKKGPLISTVEVPTITPRAEVLTGWRGADWKDVKDRRVLQLAGMILDTRLREEIREKRSLTYSSALVANASRAYTGTGFFSAYFTTDPDKATEAAKVATETMISFVADGPFEKEMETVHKQIKNQLENQMREPFFWATVLSDMDFRGTKLPDVKELVAKMTTYTREDVISVLKQYVIDDRRIEAIAKPAPKAK